MRTMNFITTSQKKTQLISFDAAECFPIRKNMPNDNR